MKTTIIRWAAATVIGFGLGLTAVTVVTAEEAKPETAPVEYPLNKPAYVNWSFAGLFGQYDQAQLQRGYQVYKEVCAACHSMNLVKFRNLAEEGGPGFSEEQVKTLAAEYTITDSFDDSGEPVERPRLPKDAFPAPYPNEQATRAANGGALPPDMSLLAKSRAVHRGFPRFIFDIFAPYQEQGPDYIHALLTGYQDAPAGVTVPDGQYYNPYFLNGPSLAMPPPLSDEQVSYTDGSPMTVDQYSKDVSAFLMWAAEPHLDARKQLGFKVMIFLVVFAGLLYYAKRKVWADVAH